MGTYCVVRDVRLALTPSADSTDDETASILPDWQLEDAIAEAEGVVGAYVLGRYTIPSVEVTEDLPDDEPDAGDVTYTVAPAPIRGWARDIAAYLAALTFRKNKDLGKDDPIRLRFLWVMEMLTAVRDGKMSLPNLPPATEPNATSGVWVENLYTGTLFGPEDFGLGSGAPYSGPQVLWPVKQ